MNDPAAIQAALEPHGYIYEPRPGGAMGFVNPESHYEITGESLFIEKHEEALAHFLDDKAQTGARMADLLDCGVWQSIDGWAGWCINKAGPLNTTSTGNPDEAIAALWLKVKGLKDPRGDA